MQVTHDDAVLLVRLQAHGGDVADISAAQRAEETGLTVLMAGQQRLVCHY